MEALHLPNPSTRDIATNRARAPASRTAVAGEGAEGDSGQEGFQSTISAFRRECGLDASCFAPVRQSARRSSSRSSQAQAAPGSCRRPAVRRSPPTPRRLRPWSRAEADEGDRTGRSPNPIAAIASMRFQEIVRYSSRIPNRSRSGRSAGAALLTGVRVLPSDADRTARAGRCCARCRSRLTGRRPGDRGSRWSPRPRSSRRGPRRRSCRW